MIGTKQLAELAKGVKRRRVVDATVPLLPGLPLVGSIVDWRTDAFQTVAKAMQLGDIARMNILHDTVFFVKHPDAVERLLESSDVWQRTEGLAPLIGRNMLTTNGDEWLGYRQMAQPHFHPRMVDRSATSFATDVAPLLADWTRFSASGRSIDLAAEAIRLFARASAPRFGFHVSRQEAERWPEVISMLQHWAFRAISGGSRRTSTIDEGMAFLDAIIDRSLEQPAPAHEPPSLLERLRQDKSVVERSVCDQLRLFLIAMADNPPNAFAYVVRTLACNPRWEEAVRAEIDTVLGDALPTPEAVETLPLLDRVVKETLRLFPPVWILARRPKVETELLGHVVPAGTLTIAAIYHAHRHATAWPDPETFDPDRFLPEAVASRHRFAYAPFGAGPRMCIGSRFATLQIRTLLVMFLRRFRARVEDAGPLPLEGHFALRSRTGIRVQLEAVAGNDARRVAE